MRRTAAVLVAAALCPPLSAQIDLPTREQEDDQFSFQLGIYEQSDGSDNLGGNPFIDEEETVYEAIIILDRQMSERDRMNVRFLGDLVSSASITRETNPMFQALQSNPSGNEHGEIGVGWTRDFERYTLGGNLSVGAEASDYFSGGWGLSLAIPLADGNTHVDLSYQGYYDNFALKLFDGTEPGRDQRRTHTLTAGVTQILTPRTIANLTFDYTRQSGFLATTWHSVFVNGTEVRENVPSSRHRDALTLRLKQAFSEYNAVELSVRYYDDSWDIDSETYELRLFQYLFGKRLLLEPNYRYYDQDAAFFYRIAFDTVTPFRSSDPDLGQFDGNSYGIKGTLIEPAWLPGWKADISLSFDYYDRSDGIDLYWATVGYTARF